MKPKILIVAALLLSASVTFAAPTNDLTGDWHGTLDTGAAKLRLVFKISKAASGEWTAKLDSLDQGARDIPVNSVSLSNHTLRLEVKTVGGVYEGTLDASRAKAAGQWSQGGGVLPLTLARGQGMTGGAEVEKLSPDDLAANKRAAQKLVGTWNGTLAVGATSLRLRMHISKTAAGGATGTMDSLDQGANGIPLSAITLKESKVRFEARGIGGVYDGTLDAGGSGLTGEWQQGGHSIPLDLKQSQVK